MRSLQRRPQEELDVAVAIDDAKTGHIADRLLALGLAFAAGISHGKGRR